MKKAVRHELSVFPSNNINNFMFADKKETMFMYLRFPRLTIIYTI